MGECPGNENGGTLAERLGINENRPLCGARAPNQEDRTIPGAIGDGGRGGICRNRPFMIGICQGQTELVCQEDANSVMLCER